MTRNGAPSMRSAARRPASLPTLITAGSGPTRKKFEDAGLTALLGCGFDPGVTQAYCAYAAKHEFDSIDTIDILDCNGGDHGYAFATNFNPEINLREVSAPGSYMAERQVGRDPGHEHQARVQL